MNELFDELTRWGQKGYAISLRYGMTMQEECICLGWSCAILCEARGTVAFGFDALSPSGFHETDALAAVREALRKAIVRWPEMVEGM